MSRDALVKVLRARVDESIAAMHRETQALREKLAAEALAQVRELKIAADERLTQFRREQETLHERRLELEKARGVRALEDTLVAEALASIRERVADLRTADPARYTRAVGKLLERAIREREGPLDVRVHPSDVSRLAPFCDGIEGVTIRGSTEVKDGFMAEEPETRAVVDGRLSSLVERSRQELETRLLATLFAS